MGRVKRGNLADDVLLASHERHRGPGIDRRIADQSGFQRGLGVAPDHTGRQRLSSSSSAAAGGALDEVEGLRCQFLRGRARILRIAAPRPTATPAQFQRVARLARKVPASQCSRVNTLRVETGRMAGRRLQLVLADSVDDAVCCRSSGLLHLAAVGCSGRRVGLGLQHLRRLSQVGVGAGVVQPGMLQQLCRTAPHGGFFLEAGQEKVSQGLRDSLGQRGVVILHDAEEGCHGRQVIVRRLFSQQLDDDASDTPDTRENSLEEK